MATDGRGVCECHVAVTHLTNVFGGFHDLLRGYLGDVFFLRSGSVELVRDVIKHSPHGGTASLAASASAVSQ